MAAIHVLNCLDKRNGRRIQFSVSIRFEQRAAHEPGRATRNISGSGMAGRDN
jgi:hypothetical protein